MLPEKWLHGKLQSNRLIVGFKELLGRVWVIAQLIVLMSCCLCSTAKDIKISTF